MVFEKRREIFRNDLADGKKISFAELRSLDKTLKKDFIKFKLQEDKEVSIYL